MQHSATERPADSAGAISARLATQQREREKALRRVRKLRERASAEIERLIAFMDASDGYSMTEFEEGADDGPVDDNELEPSLGFTAARTGMGQTLMDPGDDREAEDEHDEDNGDREWSLGFLEQIYQDGVALSRGFDRDLEDEHDGAEPDEDGEPSLGSNNCPHNQTQWAIGSMFDGELDNCDRESDEPLLSECSDDRELA